MTGAQSFPGTEAGKNGLHEINGKPDRIGGAHKLWASVNGSGQKLEE